MGERGVMTVPPAPLPGLRELLSAVLASGSNGERWLDDRGGRRTVVRLFRRASVGLAAGVEAYRMAKNADRVTLWAPSYFCDEALGPLRSHELRIRFYPIDRTLAPDWHTLDEQVRREAGPQILMLVHYFGFPNQTHEARAFCDRVGMELLEDAAHVAVPISSCGDGDFAVFSPRKILAVPAGGVLLVPEEWQDFVPLGTSRSFLRENLTWLVRRLLQQLLIWLDLPWHRTWRGRDDETRDRRSPRSQDDWPECDTATRKLLEVVSRRIGTVIERRRQHYLTLQQWSRDVRGAQAFFGALPDGVCPYAFPLLVDEGCAKVVSELRAHGIPAGRWPDLSPEVLAAGDDYAVALDVQARLVLLPVHQSLSHEHVATVGRQLRAALSASV